MQCHYDQITPTAGIPFLPKYCSINEKVTLWLVSPDEIYCDTEAICSKVPLSDYFYIYNRYTLKINNYKSTFYNGRKRSFKIVVLNQTYYA